MFDSVRNNKKIVQIFLALITLPFAFFGVDSYVKNSGAGNDLASVGDTKITAVAQLVGDVLVFSDATRERKLNPGRLLLKDGGRRLVGEVDFIEPPIVVSVDMRRVN